MRVSLLLFASVVSCSSSGSSNGIPDGGVPNDTGPSGTLSAPTFVGARSFSAPGRQEPTQVAVDATGAIYLVGRAAQTLALSPLVSVTASDSKYPEIFLAKLSPNGEAMWVKALGPSVDGATATIGLDGSGNVVLLVTYVGSYTLDGVKFDSTTTTGSSRPRSALMQLDSMGTIVWSKSLSTRLCSLNVEASGAFSLFQCAEGPDPLDFGGGAMKLDYLERAHAFFDAKGTYLSSFKASHPFCAGGAGDGGVFVIGEQYMTDTVAGTAIPTTASMTTLYLANVGPDAKVRKLVPIGSSYGGDYFCELFSLSGGSSVGYLLPSSSADVEYDFAGQPLSAPKGQEALFRVRSDTSFEWKKAGQLGTNVFAEADGTLAMVTVGDGPFDQFSAHLPDTFHTLSDNDAFVLGLDGALETAKWGARIESAGNGGPFSALDPTNGDLVLFGLAYTDTIHFDVPLTGEKDGDLYLVRVRPPK